MRLPGIALPEASWRSAIIALLLASLLVPLVVGYGFFFPYVVPRNIFFRVVVELGVAAVVIAVCFSGRRFDLHDEPIFWSLLAFVAASLVSAIFAPAPMHSLFGDFERMGGVWAWLHLLLFFLLLRTLRDEDWPWILNGALIVSVIVSLIAVVEQTQGASAQTAGVAAPSTATVGNSGLLAAYLLMGIGIAAYLASTTARFRLLYLAAAFLDLVALVLAQNRSTLVGLVAAALLGAVIYAALTKNRTSRILVPSAAIAVGIAVIGSAVIVRSFPGGAFARHVPMVFERLAATDPGGADESRTLQWRAAIEGFKDRPVLGYGPESYNLVWSAHFDPDIYRYNTDVYDRTHNQYLETLATGGLVGIIAFAAIWLAIAVTLSRAFRAGRLTAASLAVLCGAQLAYGIHLALWFFDLNSTMVWILVGALISSRGTVGSVVLEPTARDARIPAGKPAVAAVALAILVGALVWEGYVPLRAARALANIDSPRGSLANTLSQYEILERSPPRQTGHTPMIMGEFLASLRPRQAQWERDPQQRAQLNHVLTQSLDAFAREIRRDPLNDRLYTQQASLLMFATAVRKSPAYRQQAIDALHKAIDLSPRRIEQWLALAGIYLRENDYERAIVVLNDAIKQDPMLGEPRYRLASAYLGAGKSDSALVMLQSSLRLGYVGPPEPYLAIGKRLEFSGRSNSAAKLYSGYLEAKYSKAVWDRGEPIDRPVPSADLALAAHLPLLYVRSRESDLAIKSAAALSAFDPSRAPIVDRFVSDLGARRRGNWIARASLLPCKTVRSARVHDSTAIDACGIFRRKL